MLHIQTEAVRQGDIRETPPTRDRLPTIPVDLSEYAWTYTGPQSWSDGLAVAEPVAQDACDHASASGSSTVDDMRAELLVDLWHCDVPYVVGYFETVVDASEARILSLVDGRATIGTLLEVSGLPLPDVLGVLCELCARGVITLDRSQRVARRDSDMPGDA